MTILKFSFAFLALIVSFARISRADEPLVLADHGKTEYVIVCGQDEQAQFAATELQTHLEKSTGASFRRIAPGDAAGVKHRIIIGNNALSKELLGERTLAELKPEESLVITKGDDLILVGEGSRGTAYAVYSFLENETGCRWFTAYGENLIPPHARLAIPQLKRSESPAFPFRNISQYFYDRDTREPFFFRNRLNLLHNPGNPILTSALPEIGPASHTLFYFINPGPEKEEAWKNDPTPPRASFFETNPEFFSMDEQGKRVKSRQLCFSNQELRRTFTEQVEAVIKESGLSKGVVAVDANDVPGSFCRCADCMALEKKYGTAAGPLLDYLMELCGELKKKYPGVFVKTLAYRKDQSEKPPRNLEKLPENLIVIFAPIDDNFAVPLDHPDNQGTLANLKEWVRLGSNVWVWYYTNPYITPNPPLGNIEKLAHDTRLLHEIGVTGVYFEHTSGVRTGYNFAELQTWLLLKLFQNPNQDLDGLVREFTDFYYGAAAPSMREYLKELEEQRKGLSLFMQWNPSFTAFSFYTPECIEAWQRNFDLMEQLVKDSPKHLLHVRTARIPLDTVVLRKWQEIKERYPESAVTPQQINDRILANFEAMLADRHPTEEGKSHDRALLRRDLPQIFIQASVQPKPLPETFSAFPSDSIGRAFPMRNVTEDHNAACGIAISKEWNKNPVEIGLYDNLHAKNLVTSSIAPGAIRPNVYSLYKLGTSSLTPNCLIFVTTGWIITVPVDQFYVIGDPFIKWDIYVSLKFEGPAFDAKNSHGPNKISCDQVVLVKRQASQNPE